MTAEDPMPVVDPSEEVEAEVVVAAEEDEADEEEIQAAEEEEEEEDVEEDEGDEEAEDAQPLVVEAEGGDDDDEDEADNVVVAAVVVEDEEVEAEEEGEEDEIAEEVVVAEPVSVERKTPTKTPKEKPQQSTPEPTSSTSPPQTSSSSKSKPKKKRPRIDLEDSSASGPGVISPERLEAAKDARALLRETVPTLPVSVAETQIRSFGRLCIEPSNGTSKFATANALYPIGFSCDRYEFSPVHGRLLKLRCSILDGCKVKAKQKAGGFPVSDVHDGPVFRVLWGRGVDEDTDDVDYPFDPSIHAKPVTLKKADGANDGNSTSEANTVNIFPEVGMRVKVRFTKDLYVSGTVTSVSQPEPKKKRKTVQAKIQYDDGSSEVVVYPDPDVILVMPGVENEVDSKGRLELTELNGKPVSSVVGLSPLDAWGKVLAKLGLIDEIILTDAMDAVLRSRAEGLQEVKEKLEGRHRKGRSEKGDDIAEATSVAGNEDDDREEKRGAEGKEEDGSTQDREEPTEEERTLRSRVEELMSDLEKAQQDHISVAEALANTRIACLGPFLCNPFHDDENGRAQQISWLTTAVRKEKARMGSTGNRKKVVAAVDLLERNDTLYNTDIEALIEGLPGSEFLNSYIFQSLRTGNASAMNRTWIHEAQLKQEKEELNRLKRTREAEAKEHQELERAKKRQKREEDRDAKKKQKQEEEEEKKKARVEERLARLKLQVEDRLYKEASFQREKVITSLARGIAKEFNRRRKAAEIVAAQYIAEAKTSLKQGASSDSQLPGLGKVYDEDTVRVWNFLATFADFFLQKGYITEIPSLDSLQNAIACLRSNKSQVEIDGAVSSLTNLAVALCKPLAASLTRILFASLIALNPTLQKDFGATFFNGVNSTDSKEERDESAHPDIILPVNEMTWQEIARLSFLSDALGEIGLQRHEVAHILRGYRSAGHPNSKEARRLRRAEDLPIALLRQELSQSGLAEYPVHTMDAITRVDIPCKPLASPPDLVFFFHNLRSIPETMAGDLKMNFFKIVDLLGPSGKYDVSLPKHETSTLRRLLENVETETISKPDARLVKKARDAFLAAFDDQGDPSSTTIFEPVDSTGQNRARSEESGTGKRNRSNARFARRLMGLLNLLRLSSSELKIYSHRREEYMEEALKLKEEMERAKLEEGDEEEDDDDDEEDEVENDDGGVDDTNDAVVVPEKLVASTSDHENARVSQSVGENGASEATTLEAQVTTKKIGKSTAYDEFCGDIPSAPELIRRCLAVLRTLAGTGPAEPFLYPVDPQSTPGYYDMVLRPMCLSEAGKCLQTAAAKAGEDQTKLEDFVERAVLEFGRNIRLISQNCLSYANAGPTVISAGVELLRIFERLFFDWVLAPYHLRPPLEDLDDDKCVEHHKSDEDSTVLLCDGCEGKYNVTRLDPPLKDIPKGDWYCPRCVSGRWWGHLDPRIGRNVSSFPCDVDGAQEVVGPSGRVSRCVLTYPEGRAATPSLAYVVEFEGEPDQLWSLDQVDSSLARMGTPVSRISCLEAVAESPGYGFGVDHGLRTDLVPVPLNPTISDTAAQVTLSSSVFRDTISASATLLLIDPSEMQASEWLRMLVLLVMKCASSDVIQNVVSKMEAEAAERMVKQFEKMKHVTNIQEILPELNDKETNDGMVKQELEPTCTISSNGAMNWESNGSSKAEKTLDTFPPAEHTPVVVEAKAVEVIDDMDVDGPTVVNAISSELIQEIVQDEAPFAVAYLEKARRQKAIEDSFAAFCIKSQLKPTIASFEEDAVSGVVDSTMSPKSQGLEYSSLRSRRISCCFCGLTDIALGLPLVRVPNDEEWEDVIPHAARSRRVHLIAELASTSSDTPGNKLVAVKIQLGGETISFYDKELEEIKDGGMLEFCPISEVGFQDDLAFRYENALPFVTGSLSAHECCAIAAHNARKEQMIQNHRQHEAELIEKEAGMTCGRTLEVGKDRSGRSFWRFNSDSGALFVCEDASMSSLSEAFQASWRRFSEPDVIASVIVGLGKDAIVRDLKRLFPQAARMVADGSWSDQLQKRRYSSLFSDAGAKESVDKSAELGHNVVGGFEPFEVGEHVLVESLSGKLLWDAHVTAVSTKSSHDASSAAINSYRVTYKEWGTRFTEWVEARRVVEPNENNIFMQDELFEERAASRWGLPAALNDFTAKNYLHARDRARGTVNLPDFSRISYVDPTRSSNDRTFGLMKAALLAIEAALPQGCVDNSDYGPWRPEFAQRWRLIVENAAGPCSLMRCVILLEDYISEEWIKGNIGHLRSCLPARWKAIGEASPSSLAVRLLLLDRAIMYGTVDRKRFASRKKKKAS